jgi:transcriptional regulator with XRE-family HTH domain
MQDYAQAVRERVGRNVQRLRKMQSLTQEALAESVGNTDRHIGQIERGEVNVGIDVLASLAAHLAVDVAELFADSGDAHEEAGDRPAFYSVPREAFESLERSLGAVLRAKRSARPGHPSEPTK